MAKKKTKKAEKNAVLQGNDVGYCNPPDEYKFPPGVSGNPKGSPKHRTHLWTWYCKYMSMTDKELEKLDKEEMTQAQKAALKMVEDIKEGKYSACGKMARYTVDRDEGKAVEHIMFGDENALSDDECEEIREVLLKNHADK